jgi:hypothetical protein
MMKAKTMEKGKTFSRFNFIIASVEVDIDCFKVEKCVVHHISSSRATDDFLRVKRRFLGSGFSLNPYKRRYSMFFNLSPSAPLGNVVKVVPLKLRGHFGRNMLFFGTD